ncbi:trimeric intracellular cation channel family protein [Brumimicrobium aurantiacum]|uniref:Trimeric intracellular cation channel family protein n=1 Tax=Brumimicrobium aurantiacum TaxID=1737063 RepID=A0A3E1F0Z2_9FLAO|nr:trimeric intracellular cation channel family protein [Brumimicrobium aurantiacum]RFC55486.1 trimeric intracellular cation channel family protein [Brumimicrobium aurantiacum]
MLELLDHIGLFAFAISGVLTAANRNLDILGGYIIAFITALGGGTIRDLLLNVDIAWMTSFSQLLMVIAGATVGIVFRKKLRSLRRTLSIFDTVGISVFTIVGVQKGLSHEQLAITAVFLGMISATFGGLIRDVLCNEIPLIFKKEVYAIPCLLGGAIYLLGDYLGLGDSAWLLWLSMLFIVTFRTLAVMFSWKLPLINEIN